MREEGQALPAAPKSSVKREKTPSRRNKEPETVSQSGKSKRGSKMPEKKTVKKEKSHKCEKIDKRKRGRPKNSDRPPNRASDEVKLKTKTDESDKSTRKRKLSSPLLRTIKIEVESPPPPKKPKISESNLGAANDPPKFASAHRPKSPNEKSNFPQGSKKSPSSDETIPRSLQFVSGAKKDLFKACSRKMAAPKKVLSNENSSKVRTAEKDSGHSKKGVPMLLTAREVKREYSADLPPPKSHPQRMASLDAMARMHVLCITERRTPSERSKASLDASKPMDERIVVKKEREEFGGSSAPKQIDEVKKEHALDSRSAEEPSGAAPRPAEKKNAIVASSDTKIQPKQQSYIAPAKFKPAQQKDAKLVTKYKEAKTATKHREAKPAKQKEAKSVTKHKEAKPTTKHKDAKPTKQKETKPTKQRETKPTKQKETKPAKQKEKKSSKAQNKNVAGLATKSASEKKVSASGTKTTSDPKLPKKVKPKVKAKEATKMQKACPSQSATVVALPVASPSQTQTATIVDEKEERGQARASESRCAVRHATDYCKYRIIPFAHMQSCGASAASSATTYSLHRCLYSRPDCGCCCSNSLVREPCLLRKSAVPCPHLPPAPEHLCSDCDRCPAAPPFPELGCCACCGRHRRSTDRCVRCLSPPSPLDLSLARPAAADPRCCRRDLVLLPRCFGCGPAAPAAAAAAPVRRFLLEPKPLPCKKRKFAHGWTWAGSPVERFISLTNDSIPRSRQCYPAVRHREGDLVRERDCVLLKSGPRDADLPYVAKVAAFWEDPDDGEMMMSLLWYYRPEHTEQGRKPGQMEDEVFASKHRDTNSVACIEDKCYVLTFAEYCRYRAELSRGGGSSSSCGVAPGPAGGYPRRTRLPPVRAAPDMVLFCRSVYDFRQKRLLKNPT